MDSTSSSWELMSRKAGTPQTSQPAPGSLAIVEPVLLSLFSETRRLTCTHFRKLPRVPLLSCAVDRYPPSDAAGLGLLVNEQPATQLGTRVRAGSPLVPAHGDTGTAAGLPPGSIAPTPTAGSPWGHVPALLRLTLGTRVHIFPASVCSCRDNGSLSCWSVRSRLPIRID